MNDRGHRRIMSKRNLTGQETQLSQILAKKFCLQIRECLFQDKHQQNCCLCTLLHKTYILSILLAAMQDPHADRFFTQEN